MPALPAREALPSAALRVAAKLMPDASPYILGIESSCDETAAAVVSGPQRVLSNVIATQHDLHERYAGVVPEIASRAHLERIMPVITDALSDANVSLHELDAVAVGHRPGLIGSLLVGVSAAKALAWSLDAPLIGIDHTHAHLHAGLLDADPVSYPATGLVVSGGHTSLFLMRDPIEITALGRTIDDAVGEAYDKAATILHLGYPGGPAIDRLAARGDDRAHDLPVSLLSPDSLDFSFSGLKTALLYSVCGTPGGHDREGDGHRDASSLNEQEKADYAASFQRAAITAVMKKLRRTIDRFPEARTLLVGGGVSANTRLRTELEDLASQRELDLRLPRIEYCLDNAAMIAGLAAVRFERGMFDDLTLTAKARGES
jgi:N6-L-threonylcarbamoyladenine synthase